MIGKVIYSLLSGATAVTDIVSNRIYPLRNSEIKTFPAITYLQTNKIPTDTKDAVSGFDKVDVDIDCFSKDYSQLATLAAAVRTALDKASGTIQSQVISECRFVREFEGFDDETGLYQRTIEFRFIVIR